MPDFDKRLAELKSEREVAIALLREHGESHWLSRAEKGWRELDRHDAAAFDHILGGYGGVDSFNATLRTAI